jgi:predicted RNase H-like HicB family nuclease
MTHKFSVLITKEKNWYVARCPELDVTSQGKTIEKAKENLREAVELYIESFGLEDIPQPKSDPIWTTLEIKVCCPRCLLSLRRRSPRKGPSEPLSLCIAVWPKVR